MSNTPELSRIVWDTQLAGIDRGCRSFQALAAILDYVTNLAPMSCWYRSDATKDEFRLFQAALL